MAQLILLRHGQSQWNLQNRFTGWVDVDLSEKGIEEAKRAGAHLSAYTIDHLYTSVLMRAEKQRPSPSKRLVRPMFLKRVMRPLTSATMVHFKDSTRMKRGKNTGKSTSMAPKF